MKAKILLLLTVCAVALSFAACGDNGTGKLDVEKYREKVREQRQNDPKYSKENQKAVRKAIFPNMKDTK